MKHHVLCYLLMVAFSVIFPSLQAQEVGSWTLYPASGSVGQVATTGDLTYALTGNTLFSYTASDESVSPYTRQTGLSSTGIDYIAYSEAARTLVIVYESLDIDLLHDGTITNLPELKDRIMTGTKQVNSVYIDGERAFLATSFGLIVIDLTKQVIAETYQTGRDERIGLSLGNYILAASNAGIFACSLNNNPYDKGNWKNVIGLTAKHVATIGDNLYILDSAGMLFCYDTNWQQLANTSGYTGMTTDGEQLYLYNGAQLTVLDANLNRLSTVTLPYEPTTISVGKSGNELWAGSNDGLFGMRLSGDTPTLIEEKINIDAQTVSAAYAMTFAHNRLYATTGGPFRTLTSIPGQISILNDGSWTNIGYSATTLSDSYFRQILDIAVSPTDPNHFAVGFFRRGIAEFRDGQFYQQIGTTEGYLSSSSSSNKNDYIWVSGLKFDSKGNLWAVNSKVDYPLRMREASTGNWYKYAIEGLSPTEDLISFLITRNGRSEQKWFLSYLNVLTLNVFDDNGTPDNTADDQSVCLTELIDQDGNEYNYANGLYLYAVEEDQDGKVWIGSNIGLFVMPTPYNVFSTGGVCTRPKVPRNDGTGLADYLLDGEQVTCIRVDAANRKWVGTQGNGVYLLSPDGLETVHHFTADNSMLPSDEILTIAIDDNSGRVFFGCSTGIAAYQSDATVGADDYTEVYAYPNPVRPDYQGSITVRGLMDNTLVKITDINNNLIYQSTSLGGQFSWDGLNRRGERVKSGIYLVYGSSEDGKKGVVTKIMIIR